MYTIKVGTLKNGSFEPFVYKIGVLEYVNLSDWNKYSEYEESCFDFLFVTVDVVFLGC